MTNRDAPLKPRWRRILRKIFFTTIVLIVAIVVALSIWNYITARQLRDEIAKIRAAGEPVTFADLARDLPAIEDADDAARYYRAGLALMADNTSDQIAKIRAEFSTHFDGPLADKPPDELLQKAQQLLNHNREALEMFDKGANRPAYRFRLDIKHGIGGSLGGFSKKRLVARLFSVRTAVMATQGDGEVATDSVISSLRATRMLDEPAGMIYYLVKLAVVAMACNDVKSVLEHSHPPDHSLIELHNALAVSLSPDILELMLIGERVYGIELTRNLFPGDIELGADQAEPGFLSERWPTPMPLAGAWMRQMEVGNLRYLAGAIAAARKPWPDVMDAMADVHPVGMFAKLLAPAFDRVVIVVAKVLADLRCTMVAVAIERYRQANGRLPTGLAELTPNFLEALPADPFSGRDLLYSQDDHSYTVYSVGENRKDDGGDVQEHKDKSKNNHRPLDHGVRIRLRTTVK